MFISLKILSKVIFLIPFNFIPKLLKFLFCIMSNTPSDKRLIFFSLSILISFNFLNFFRTEDSIPQYIIFSNNFFSAESNSLANVLNF